MVAICWQQLWSEAKVEQEAILIFEQMFFFYLKPAYLAQVGV